MTAMSISTRRFGSGGALGRVAALMALFAMIGVLALSTWHDGMPHSHAAVHATSVDRDHHEHAPSKTPDMADVLHMAAHAVIQTIDVPRQPVLSAMLKPVPLQWSIAGPQAPGAIHPDGLLRPPRG